VVLTFKQPIVKTTGKAAEAARKLAENVASVGRAILSVFFEPRAHGGKTNSAGFSKVEFLDLGTADKPIFRITPGRPAETKAYKHCKWYSVKCGRRQSPEPSAAGFYAVLQNKVGSW